MMDQRKLSHQEVTGLAQVHRSGKFRSKDLNNIWFWILHQYTFHCSFLKQECKWLWNRHFSVIFFFTFLSLNASFTPPYGATKQGDLWFWLSFPPQTPSVFSWCWVVNSLSLFGWDRDMSGYGRLTSGSNMILRPWTAVQISSGLCGVSIQLSTSWC